MSASASISGSAAIIRELYRDGDVPMEFYLNNNEFIDVPKEEDFVGNPARIAVMNESTQGASSNFTNAQANLAQSTYNDFSVTRVTYYSIARVDGHAMMAAQGSPGSLVDLWKREVDSAMHTAVRMLAIYSYRSGTGSIGQISSGSNVATTSITLATIDDITNFFLGMAVNASASDGGATRNSSAKEVVAGIDRVNGTLTCTSAAWNTVIAAIAASDFLYRDGDAANNSTNVVPTGFKGWIPGTATPGTLFGLNRNTDPTRLGGNLFNATGVPIEEAVIEGIARVGIQGGTPDRLYCHPREKASLAKSLEGKVRYMGADRGEGKVGFSSLEFESDYGPVKIVSDMNCPRFGAFLTQRDTWFYGSIGKLPRILDFDDVTMLRVSTADQYELRVGAYCQKVCRAPAWNLQFSNFGN